MATGSMRPALWRGARVWLRSCGASELCVGDPVLYLNDRALPVLHRLLSADGNRWVVRGDANDDDDPPLDPAKVIGTVEGLVAGRWQWRGAPRPVQRAARWGWLRVLPVVRMGLLTARRARKVF